jgi:hypothetical protein
LGKERVLLKTGSSKAKLFYINCVIGSFATTKANYSMKTLFDSDMGRLTDSGIIQKLFLDVTPPKNLRSGAQSQVLDLWHFMSIFMLCGCLMLAAILIFIVELFKKPIQ